MVEAAGSGAGAPGTTPQGGATGSGGAGEGGELTLDGKPFDAQRAMATITAQRETEASAKKEAADARAELKTLQDRITEAERKAEEEKTSKLSESERTAKEVAELKQQLVDADTAGRSRVAKAALKASAAAAGAVYPGDVPALIDASKVKFDKDGEPTNADDLVVALKESRPALFTERKPGSGDGGARGSTPEGRSMDDLLRSAAGH